MKPVIGILGGMGPRATVQFEQLLLRRLPGTDQQLPTIVTINDGSIPDRSSFILGTGRDPVPQLQRNLDKLELLGAEIVCIPCNTACAPAIFNRLQSGKAKILNLPEIVGQFMTQQKLKKVYLLGTAGTVQAGSYQSVCEQRGIKCLVPASGAQHLVNIVIQAVKSGDLTKARFAATRLKKVIATSDCDGVVLGCTELPLVQSSLVPAGMVAIDTLAILADECVRYTQTNELKGKLDDARRIYN